MADIRIQVPDATTNYIKNPSMRYATTGWTAIGSTISRSLLEARFGIASLQVITNGSALYEGVYYRINSLTSGTILTGSVYLRGSGIVRIRLIEAGVQTYSKTVELREKWQRLQVLGRCVGSTDVRLYIETDKRAQAVTFYVDGAMVEPKPQASSYVDGDQPGCRWSGIKHDSISTRDGATREGGRWVKVSGEDRASDDIYVTTVGGLGTAPIVNNVQPYAVAPGGYYQSTKILSRIFTILFHTKHKSRKAESLENLHQLRNSLFDLIRPDKVRGGQAFMLEYTDGDIPLTIPARYDGGMEGDWDVRNSWVNSFPVRFLSMSPFLTEDNQEVDALNFINDMGVLNFCAAKLDGNWSVLNYGMNSTVRGFVEGPDGKIYAFGDFLFANENTTLAIDPHISAAGICYWDGEKWNKMGTGAISSGGYIAAAAVAPNGYVYVTGSFSSIGGVAAANAAYWNGTTWNAMGSGLNAYGSAVKIAPNGRVYFGGNFTTAGGTTANYTAYWDGAWHAIGEFSGLNLTVEDIAITRDGSLIYFAGQFTDERNNPGNNLDYICSYNPSTDRFAALALGTNGIVYSIAIASNGVLYATGAFTTAGTATVNYAALWDGAAWKAIGTGLNATGYVVFVAPNGDVYFGGSPTTAGDIPVSFAARWNGSVWLPLDIAISITATPIVLGLLVDSKGDLYLGGSGFTTGSKRSKSAATTTITNQGNAQISPSMYIFGPGSLKWIENQTTKKVVQFDLEILDDEEVFLDFGKGTVISSVRGSLADYILPGTSFRDFTLLPGTNKIAAFMMNDVASFMQISHVPHFWGVDSTVTEEVF